MECNNCDTVNYRVFSKVKCFYTKVPLSVVQCSNCGLVYLNPRPDKSLGLAYFENAYSNAQGFEGHSYYRDHDQIFKRNKIRLDMVNNLPVPNQKILDFGAGQGHFVKTALDGGWKATGLELSRAAIQAAKMNCEVELLDSLQKVDSNDFGLITLWDVIEHLENPKVTLLQLSRYLHPNGFFVIETSNIESLDYLVHKKNWSYWHVDHLYYYSRKTISYLFQTFGFQPFSLDSHSNSPKKATSHFISKYKTLLNPKNLITASKKRWLSYKFKDFERNSLMTVAFRRK